MVASFNSIGQQASAIQDFLKLNAVPLDEVPALLLHHFLVVVALVLLLLMTAALGLALERLVKSGLVHLLHRYLLVGQGIVTITYTAGAAVWTVVVVTTPLF